MSEQLSIRALTILQTPGFRNGALKPMTFCDGINIVFGPNASGKTTTARAIQALLWPTGNPATYLTAEIALGDRTGQYLYSGTRQDDPALPLPFFDVPESRRRYMLAQHELLAVEEKGQDFAEMILNQARGGVDFTRAKNDLHYMEVKRQNRAADYDKAQQQFQQALASEQVIREIEQGLPEIIRQIEEAQAAQARLEQLTHALAYREQQRKEGEYADALAQFPTEFATLNGNELTELNRLTAQIELADKNCTDAERQIANATARRLQTRLVEIAPLETSRSAAKSLLEEIGKAENELRAARKELQRAETSAQEAYRHLGGQDPAVYADPLDATVLSVLETLMKGAVELATKREAHATQLRWLDSLKPAEEHTARLDIEEAERRLREWLAAGAGIAGPSRWVLGIGVAVMLCGVLAGIVNQSLFGWLALCGGLALVGWYLRAGKPVTPSRTRADVQDSYAGELPRPSVWEENEVNRLLRDLRERIVALTLAERIEEKRRQLLPEEEAIRARETELNAERDRVAALLKIDPARVMQQGATGLYVLVNHLIDWRRECTAKQCAAEEIARLEQEIQHGLTSANAVLTAFECPVAGNSGELSDHLEQLARRYQEYQLAQKDEDNAARQRDENAGHRTEWLLQRSELLARLGWDVEVEEAKRRLDALLPQRERYEQAKKTWLDARAVREELNRQAGRWPDWVALLATDETELAAQQRAAKASAEGKDRLIEQKATSEQQIRAAKEQAACELARDACDRAVARLQRRLEETLHASVGWYLAGELEKQLRDETLPKVFHRARALFVEFTRGRYTLQMDRLGKTFSARDETDQIERPLDQLSSATRVQLLMAVRVAFVEEREGGVKLPLLLDEVLASSDPLREEAIVTATLRICQAGRQVFYFTSKPAELARWRAQAALEGVKIKEIDLGETSPERVLDVPSLDRPVIPDPAGLSHDAYGIALGVSRIDFTTVGAAGAHVWYVVDDNVRLKQLLEAGITTGGQLCSPHLSALVDGLLGKVAASKARTLFFLLGQMEAHWQEDRGKPLTYQAIVEAEILTTETFREKIPLLAEKLNWEAKALIAALENKEITGFRASSLQKLRDYCEKNAYLFDGEPLTPEDIRERLLGQAADAILRGEISPANVHRLCDLVLGAVPA